MAKKDDEGPRGFSVLLQQIDDGSLHAELSETTQKLITELTNQADRYGTKTKGSLTVTLAFTANTKGNVEVVSEVKTKTPKEKRMPTVMFVTPGGNLSPENPRQQRLPLREVPAAVAAPRDVAVDAQPARSI